MKSSVVAFIPALIVGLALIGCEEDIGGSGEWSGPPDYPHRVHDSWEYRLVDNIRQTTGRVHVEIVGYQLNRGPRAPAGFAAVWQYAYEDGRTDTMFVASEGDTVREWGTNSAGGVWLSNELVFPLAAGVRNRVGGYPYETTRVSEKQPRVIADGTSLECYHIEQSGFGFNCGMHRDAWFAPGVGTVWAREWQTLWCDENKTWELLSYSVHGD